MRAEAGDGGEPVDRQVAIEVRLDVVRHPPEVARGQPDFPPPRPRLAWIIAEQVDRQGRPQRLGEQPPTDFTLAPADLGELAGDLPGEPIPPDRRRAQAVHPEARPPRDPPEHPRREPHRDRLERPLPADQGRHRRRAHHDIPRRRPALIGRPLAEAPLDFPGAGQEDRHLMKPVGVPPGPRPGPECGPAKAHPVTQPLISRPQRHGLDPLVHPASSSAKARVHGSKSTSRSACYFC